MQCESAYAEYKGLIHGTCRRFRRRYGGDLDDLVGQAQIAFVIACRTYEVGHGTKPATWIRHKIWWSLHNANCRHFRRKRQRKVMHIPPGDMERFAESTWTDLRGLLRELSGDANVLFEMAADIPEDLQGWVRSESKNYRRSLSSYLFSSGWSLCRVLRAFRELRGLARQY